MVKLSVNKPNNQNLSNNKGFDVNSVTSIVTAVSNAVSSIFECFTAIANYYAEKERTQQAMYYYLAVKEHCKVEIAKINSQETKFIEVLNYKRAQQEEFKKILDNYYKIMNDFKEKMFELVDAKNSLESDRLTFLYNNASKSYEHMVEMYFSLSTLSDNDVKLIMEKI